MPDPTNAARQRRWRERQAGRLPAAEPLICVACGAVHRGKHGGLCRSCWVRLTPEGKADRLVRVNRARAKRKRDGV